jgi:hypothetical protein
VVVSDPGRATAGAGPISARLAALVVVVGVVAFSALLVLVTYVSDLRQGRGGPDALSNSAIGFSGIAEALRLDHEPVVLNRAPFVRRRSSGLFVVMPGPSADLRAVEALGFYGPILVVLPKWQVVGDARHRGWVRKVNAAGFSPTLALRVGLLGQTRLRSGPPVAPELQAPGAPFAAGQILAAGPVDQLQSLAGHDWEPVLTDAAGEVVLARAQGRPIWVLADPDLMNNQGIGDERTFVTALAIIHTLQRGDGPVIFDLRLSGLGRERSALRLLFDPPFLGVTLCLAAAAALAGWQAFARFGPPRRPGRAIALGKTALVDNSAGLIRLAGREARMARRYADLVLIQAARGVGAPRTLSGPALTRFLDRLAVHRGAGERLEDLAVEAAVVRTPQRAAAVAVRLFRWRRAVVGEID